MHHKERKNYFLGLVKVSLDKTYKHVKAKDNVLRIGRNENTHTHTQFPRIVIFPTLIHIFLPTWMPLAKHQLLSYLLG